MTLKKVPSRNCSFEFVKLNPRSLNGSQELSIKELQSEDSEYPEFAGEEEEAKARESALVRGWLERRKVIFNLPTVDTDHMCEISCRENGSIEAISAPLDLYGCMTSGIYHACHKGTKCKNCMINTDSQYVCIYSLKVSGGVVESRLYSSNPDKNRRDNDDGEDLQEVFNDEQEEETDAFQKKRKKSGGGGNTSDMEEEYFRVSDRLFKEADECRSPRAKGKASPPTENFDGDDLDIIEMIEGKDETQNGGNDYCADFEMVCSDDEDHDVSNCTEDMSNMEVHGSDREEPESDNEEGDGDQESLSDAHASSCNDSPDTRSKNPDNRKQDLSKKTKTRKCFKEHHPSLTAEALDIIDDLLYNGKIRAHVNKKRKRSLIENGKNAVRKVYKRCKKNSIRPTIKDVDAAFNRSVNKKGLLTILSKDNNARMYYSSVCTTLWKYMLRSPYFANNSSMFHFKQHVIGCLYAMKTKLEDENREVPIFPEDKFLDENLLPQMDLKDATTETGANKTYIKNDITKGRNNIKKCISSMTKEQMEQLSKELNRLKDQMARLGRP